MRLLSRAAVLALGIAAALTVAVPSTSAGPSTGTWSDAVAIIDHLDDGGSAIQHVPADFPQVMGYQPQLARLADGSARVINPDGSCSVPGEGQPFDFAVPCKAHDFGYDLLRYAARTHSALPATAREDIDARLSSDLHSQCMADRLSTTRASCDATWRCSAPGWASTPGGRPTKRPRIVLVCRAPQGWCCSAGSDCSGSYRECVGGCLPQ